MQTFMISQIQAMPVTTEQIQNTTRRDPLLSQVSCYVQDGWLWQVDDKYKHFYKHKNKLFIEAGCLQYGNCVIIPEKLKPNLIDE